MNQVNVDISHSGELLEITVSGTLSAETYDILGERLGAIIEEHAPVRILFVMSGFHGWTIPGMWKDLTFEVKHRHDIERVALVGDRPWQHGMAYLCRPLTGAELRYFDLARIGDARAWLSAGDSNDRIDEVPAEIESLLNRFASDDGRDRERARRELVRMGEQAVPALLYAARTGSWQVRYEATKALAEIDSASTIAPLVAALHAGEGIRWIAAERLAHLGRPAVEAILRELISHANSVGLCQGAHHALHDLDDAGLKELVAPVVTALGELDRVEAAPVAAYAALEGLDATVRPTRG